MAEIETITLSNSSVNPTQICSEGDPVTLIYNPSETATMYISNRQSFEITSLYVTPIPPLGYTTLQPLADLFAFSPTTGSQAAIIPGGLSAAPSPAEIAAQIQALGLATLSEQQVQSTQISSAGGTTIATDISNTGTPLLHGFDVLVSGGSQVVAAGATTAVPTITFHKPGYLISGNVTGSAAATTPFVKIIVQWYNSGGTLLLGVPQIWIVPFTSSGTWTFAGSGPVRGPMMKLSVYNLDTNSVTLNYNITESTQHITRDDWRGPIDGIAGVGTVPLYNTATSLLATNADILMLQMINTGPVSIANGATINYLAPVYAGTIYFNATASAAIEMFITPPTQLTNFIGDSPLYQNGSITDISFSTSSAPRYPIRITFTNASGAAVTLNVEAHALEYTS